jgi:hypothetical protein
MWTKLIILYVINYELFNLFWTYYSLNPQKKIKYEFSFICDKGLDFVL